MKTKSQFLYVRRPLSAVIRLCGSLATLPFWLVLSKSCISFQLLTAWGTVIWIDSYAFFRESCNRFGELVSWGDDDRSQTRSRWIHLRQFESALVAVVLHCVLEPLGFSWWVSSVTDCVTSVNISIGYWGLCIIVAYFLYWLLSWPAPMGIPDGLCVTCFVGVG